MQRSYLFNHGDGLVAAIAGTPHQYGGIYTAMQIARFLDELYGKPA